MFVSVDHESYINLNHVAKIEALPSDDQGVRIYIFKNSNGDTLGQLSVSDRNPVAKDLIASIINYGKRP